MSDDNGGFRWINLEQKSAWGDAPRPETILWTGTVHRRDCTMLGRRGGTAVELTHGELNPQPPAHPPQTGICCGGDGKPFTSAPGFARGVGCSDWDREREHQPHAWRDPIEGRVRKCPGWSAEDS
jgi:hypothetical protein